MRKSLLLLLAISSILGGIIISSKMRPSSPQKHSMIPVDPLTLSNLITTEGYSVWLAPSEVPVVSVGLTFRGAGQRRSVDQPGLVDLLASMLTEGAGPYNSQEFKERLLEKNIQLSIQAGPDNITFYFRTVKENVKDAFSLVHLILTSPRFEEKDLSRVKQQLRSGIEQSLHYPETRAYEALQKAILGENHPYTPNFVKVLETLPLLNAPTLLHYMQQHLTKDAVEVVAAGNIKEEELKELVDSTLQNLPPSAPKQLLPREREAASGKVISVEMNVPQTVIYFSQPGLAPTDPDYYAFLMINLILGNTFESRLWNEVREKRGLAYFCSTSLSHRDFSHTLTGSTAARTENADQVINLIKQEWQKLVEQEITPQELDLQKNNAIGSYVLRFDSTLNIVKCLASYRQMGLPIDAVNLRNRRIQALTLEDINRVKKRIIKEASLTFVKVGRVDLNLPNASAPLTSDQTGDKKA